MSRTFNFDEMEAELLVSAHVEEARKWLNVASGRPAKDMADCLTRAKGHLDRAIDIRGQLGE